MLPPERTSSPCGSYGWREAVIAFPPYHVDLNNQKLWRHGQACPLRPKAFGVLCHLLGRPGHLVCKKEILAAVWADTHVCDDVLKVCIQEIRSALMDDARTPRFIETVSRRGYRFIAEVARSGGARPQAPGGAKRQDEVSARAVPIGRGPELRRLHDLLDRVLPGGGRPEIALVSGEAGIGKSTLVDEFLRQAAAVQGVWIAQGQCVNHRGPGEAYMPVLEALGRLCRGPAGHQVAETLNRHAPAWLAQLPALIPAEDEESIARRACGAAPPRMLREFADAMEALPAPLILSLEDLQWSDPATLDLIGYLARRKMRAPLLLIGTCREEGPDGHPAQAVLRELHACRLCTGLPVRPLRAEDVAQYLLTRFHGSIFSADVAAQLHRSTDGNPLFLANLLDHLLQQGMLVPRSGQLALAVEPHVIAVTVPRNLKPWLDQQLDQLSPELQRVLEVASVVGARFAAIVVAAALGSEVAEIEDRCTALARRSRFVEQDGDVALPDGTHTACYRFTHSIYRRLLYERTTQARRVQLHRQMGTHLAAVYGERGGEFTATQDRDEDHLRDPSAILLS